MKYTVKHSQSGVDTYFVLYEVGVEMEVDEVLRILNKGSAVVFPVGEVPEGATHYQTGEGAFLQSYVKDLDPIGEDCLYWDGHRWKDGGYDIDCIVELG